MGSNPKPIGNAIVWQCRRTADICEDLKTKGLGQHWTKTGLVIDAYFSGTKSNGSWTGIPFKERGKGEILAVPWIPG